MAIPLLLTKICTWVQKFGSPNGPIASHPNGSPAVFQTELMSPISKERVEFIRTRLSVIQNMISELSRRRHLFGANPVHIQSLLNRLYVEKVGLQLEQEVLGKMLNDRH